MKKIAIFISGRGSNMKAIVEECEHGVLKGLAEVVLVFSNKEEAAGLDYAKEKKIEAQFINSKGLKRISFDQKVVDLLANYELDYLVLAGYMRVLSPILIKEYPNQIINIHPADTKQHQGLDGYQWAFENKLEETKVTIHYVDEGLDTGEIIAQQKVDLRGADSLAEVEKRGLAVEHWFYSQTLVNLFSLKI